MQVLDRTGVGTLWSICKAKFALAGHTHSSITDGTMTVYSMQNNEVNFGGSNSSATIYFGYRAKDSKPIPSDFIFGGSTGTATLTAAKFKGALEGNASTASNASKVNGHTVNANVPSNAKFTDTNTWRGIQDNLTSTSTSESLSANQGKVLKGLVDGKANSSHTHTLGQITNAGAAASKNVRTLNSVSHSSWSSASTDDLYVPTMSFIAYWNGAYNSSGNSNLQYCYKGKFGNLAVKDTADWSQVASKPATATRWPSWGEVTGKPTMPTNITATKAQIVTISGSTVTVNASLDSYRTPGEFNIHGASSGDYAKMYVQSGIADTFNGTRVITQTIKVTISHNTYAEVCDVTRQYKSNAWSKWTVMYLGND